MNDSKAAENIPPGDPLARILIWLGAVLMLALVLWMNFATLDVVSMADGQVVPASRVKQIQHLEGGIVREILVEEGQRVKADQALVILAPTSNQAEVEELKQRIAGLKADLARLNAEVSGSQQLIFAAGLDMQYPQFVEKARELFHIRLARLESDINVQNKLVSQREQDLLEINARLKKNRTVLAHVREQLGISKKLLAQNLTSRLSHLELVRQAADLQGELAINKAVVRKVQASIEEAKARILNIRTNFEEQVRTERDKVSRSLGELSQRLVKHQDSLARMTMRAPTDGIVKAIFVSTEGGIVKPGNTVLEIVPSDDKLVIEARLPIQDIGYVGIGNIAQIRLATPDAQLFDALDGKVTHVSADTMVDENGSPYYKIKLETARTYFAYAGQKYQLYPGMQVQSGILTGERTVLDYIISPFYRSANEALRER